MEGRSVEERVIEVVADQFGKPLESIKREMSFVDDLGADSLDAVEVIMDIEMEFEIISIGDEDAAGLKTVGDVIDYVEKHIPTPS